MVIFSSNVVEDFFSAVMGLVRQYFGERSDPVEMFGQVFKGPLPFSTQHNMLLAEPCM